MASGTTNYHAEPVTPSRTVTRVFCPKGHNLLDICYTINTMAGIKLEFRRKNGLKGVVVLSPTLGCFEKLVPEGELVEGEKVELFCPECAAVIDKMGSCDCVPANKELRGDICVLYLTEDRTTDEAIAICNIVGCHNSSIRHAGEFIQA